MPTLEWRILLVDDDRDDYVLIRDIVNEFGGVSSRLTWTHKFDVALEEFDHNRHDVYLIDYRLGEHDGIDLIRRGRAQGCRGPMILLTGQGDRTVDLEAMKAGASDYLEKGSIDATLLERSIRYAIERARGQDALSSHTHLLEQSAALCDALGEPLAVVRSALVKFRDQDEGKLDADTHAAVRRACDAVTQLEQSSKHLATKFSHVEPTSASPTGDHPS